ncbi:MAG: PAS domain S-box protein, partial [Desulfobacteraceae bacterium]
MQDKGKTKDQLIEELDELRRRVAELEESKEERKEDETLAESREIDLEKLAKQRQSALEERYRALFENNPIETIIVDHDAKVTGSNLSKERSGGRVPNIGDVMYKDFAGKHEINMHKELKQCMKSGESKEFPKQRYDGKFLQIRISPFSEGAIITSIDITERVLAEDSMRKSQRQARVLAHALESSSQPFAVGYPDGRIMTYNTAYCELTGYSKEELRKVKYFTDMTPKEWHEVMAKAEDKILQTKQPQHFEKEYIRKDGSRVPVEVTEHPIYDSKGVLQHYYSFFTDIDKRRRVEEALKESETRSHALFETNPIETIIVDQEARVIDSNLSKISPSGAAPNIGDVMFKDYGGQLGVNMQTELIECMKTGVSKEFPEQKYDGRFLRIKMSPFSGGAIITLVDVTELKLLQETLKESREDYRSMFDNTGVASVIIEENMTISMVNKEFERLSGYSRHELEDKKDWKEFVAKEDTERVKTHHIEIKEKNGGLPTEYEFGFIDKSGNERDMISKVGLISGTKKSIASLLDITSSKLELQLRVAELRQVHEELSQYSRALSYDLRAPLRAIRNYADFLREDLTETLNKDHKAYLDGLDRAVREARDLVEGLLALSQIEGQDVAVKKIHMGNFLGELIDFMQMPSEVNVVFGDDWPTIEVQPVLLRQIFRCLIDNAAKFNNSSQKLIEIGWRAVDDECEFYVRDNGIGIKPRYKDKIFGVFERLHTPDEYKGTGIGLAIVKKCIAKLGG